MALLRDMKILTGANLQWEKIKTHRRWESWTLCQHFYITFVTQSWTHIMIMHDLLDRQTQRHFPLGLDKPSESFSTHFSRQPQTMRIDRRHKTYLPSLIFYPLRVYYPEFDPALWGPRIERSHHLAWAKLLYHMITNSFQPHHATDTHSANNQLKPWSLLHTSRY